MAVYLKVGTCDGLCELIEKWFLDFGKFLRVHDLKDIFHFVQEHDLFSTIDFRPVS